jgi:serine/threonine protein phosphatase PrpC
MPEQKQKEAHITSYGGTYLGRRVNNEDSLGRRIPRDPDLRATKGCLYVVCDGMGGRRGGEVASALAVQTILERYYLLEGESEICLKAAICEASAQIAAQAEEDSELEDMGSTVVAVVIVHNRLICAHVGDSRIYLLRSGGLTQITRDHLYVMEELGLTAEEATHHPRRHVLSRALGYAEASEPECLSAGCRSGDRLLLCSDGLTDSVSADALRQALLLSTPQEVVESLLELAERNEARDNTTVLAVFLEGSFPEEDPTLRMPSEASKAIG